MSIILEGPDNAGKSTLAAFLTKELSLPIKHSGGPSKYPGEVNARALQFNGDPACMIYDRHPCVSQNLYVEALKNGGELVHQRTIDEFYAAGHFIVYCRPIALDLSGHQMSEHSSDQYFEEVRRNYCRLLAVYDAWALEHAHLVYRIGYDMNKVGDLCNAATLHEWQEMRA